MLRRALQGFACFAWLGCAWLGYTKLSLARPGYARLRCVALCYAQTCYTTAKLMRCLHFLDLHFLLQAFTLRRSSVSAASSFRMRSRWPLIFVRSLATSIFNSATSALSICCERT